MAYCYTFRGHLLGPIDVVRLSCFMPRKPHYSGNFWAASCRYVSQKLKPLDSTRFFEKSPAWMKSSPWLKYIVAELWIASDRRGKKPHHASLFEGLKQWDPYTKLLLPSIYAFSKEIPNVELLALEMVSNTTLVLQRKHNILGLLIGNSTS
mmetsp:Transcript_35120/g.73145  ORF Transcript_35120/g.73145 Transcript_35120/m.73145 type:complete len:151 (+) Transcript_35120:73-525(+)